VCVASGELNGKEFEAMVLVHREIALPLVVAELKRQLTCPEGFQATKLLDETTEKKRGSGGIYQLLPKALRSRSHKSILRVPLDSGEERAVIYTRGTRLLTIKLSEIKAIVANGLHVLSFDLKSDATPPIAPKLRFDVHHEAIRDALCVAITELLTETHLPVAPSASKASAEVGSSPRRGASLSLS
jgi:hypothetical protein